MKDSVTIEKDSSESAPSPYQELYDRVQKTTRARFAAQIRLSRHNSIALACITLSSIFLLVTPLAQGFKIELAVDENTINFVQSLLTIVVLVLSVVLSMANFAVRSEKVHQCGMELNSLLRTIYPKKKLYDKDDDYEKLSKDYDEILNRYENHKKIDFNIMQLEMPRYYNLGLTQKLIIKIKYLSVFSIYILLILIEALWVSFLFKFFQVSM